MFLFEFRKIEFQTILIFGVTPKFTGRKIKVEVSALFAVKYGRNKEGLSEALNI